MLQLLRYVFGAVALAGFFASLGVHVEALMGVDVASAVPAVWLLHVGIFVVFLPFVILSRKDLEKSRSLRIMAQGLPPWLAVMGGALMVYTLVNFALFAVRSDGGSPEMQHGSYVLMEHGRVIRELTGAEYTSMKANVVRGFSGHWMMFYFVPMAYFLCWKKPVAASGSQPVSG